MRPRRPWRARTGLLTLSTLALLAVILTTGWRRFEPPPCVHDGGPPVSGDAAPPETAPSPEARGPVGWEAFRRLDELPRLPVGSQPRMFSSADPAGGNADGFSGAALCRDGDRFVLGEHAGPGELTSLWFTRGDGDVSGNGRLRIELDGRAVLDAPLQDVVDGELGPPFVAPLVANADQNSGGVAIQVPMPFRRSMRVTTDAAPHFYRIQYRVFADAAGITTFSPTDPASDVLRTLRAAGSVDPKRSQADGRTVRRPVRLAPGDSSPPVRLAGPGVVTGLQVRLPGVPTLPQPGGGNVPSGSTEVALSVDPDNHGVRVVRRTRSRPAAQDATMLIDGDDTPRAFSAPRRAEDGQFEQVVEFPGAQMSGRHQLRLADVQAGPGVLVAESFVGGAWEVTDRRPLPAPPSAFPAVDLEDPARRLRDLRLRITFDGRPTVDVPVGEFFGVGLGERPVDTLMFGVDPNGAYRAWWPMPFARGASVELVNGAGAPVTRGELQVTWRPDDRWAEDLGRQGRAGYFHATSRSGPTRPGEDWELADLSGHGRVVGIAQTMVGLGHGRIYLEGDERIRVDGARSPQLHGTGTEDLYLGGWYFNRGPFTTPFAGLSAHLQRSYGCPRECDATYRVFVADSLPFHAGLRFGIEHGPVNDVAASYGSTTFWYGRPDAAMRRTDLLDLGARHSRRSHGYADRQGWLRPLTASYPGSTEPAEVVDHVRRSRGQIRFAMAIDPDNDGVLLRRRADQGRAGQAAEVFVDGVPAGTWYQPGGNAVRRWLDDDLLLPGRLTRGRDSIEVTLRPVGGAPPWTAAQYEAYSLRPPQ